MSKPESERDGSQFVRCRRFVGNRPGARNGQCGLAAKLILDGLPLCYVHTPVAYRRELASGHRGLPRLARGGESS